MLSFRMFQMTMIFCSISQEQTTGFTFNFKQSIELKIMKKGIAIIPLVPNSFRQVQVFHNILSDALGSKSSCSKNRCSQMSFDLIRSISFG